MSLNIMKYFMLIRNVHLYDVIPEIYVSNNIVCISG